MLTIAAYIFAVCFGVGFGSVLFIRGATRQSDTYVQRKAEWEEA